MLKFQTRLMVATFVVVDILATLLAWVLAYFLRFDVLPSVIPVTKGVPDLSDYLILLPVLCLLWPTVMYFHGLYRLKRGRSRIDEFFAILFSVLVAAGLMLGATLYVRVYYRFQPDVAPSWEYSQAVFAIFVVLDVILLNFGRALLRAHMERQWAAGYNLRRVLVAGAGELGQTVAETLLAHRELGYRVVGFLDDQHTSPTFGLPVLGRLDEAVTVLHAQQVDQMYVALPLEEHAKLVSLIKATNHECVDLKVVPDLVQYATIKASLEDLDGIPIINLNEVPLSGWSSMVKRVMDAVVSAAALVFLSVVFPLFPVIAILIKLFGGKGPVLLRQERMTLDGRTFQIFKFRTMVDEAERETGPVLATSDDPRRTPVGVWLRRQYFDECPRVLHD